MHPYYVQQVFNTLRVQSDKIQQLEKQLQDIQSEVDDLKNNKATSIGPINYHFEQLKIEKLEGTLNIGITPSEGNNLDEAMVNGQTISSQQGRAIAGSERIHSEVTRYLKEEVPNHFKQLEKERNLSIDERYIQMVTQDLENQMEGRIKEYLKQLTTEEDAQLNEEQVSLITQQVQRDIDSAIKQYIELNITEGRESNEINRYQ